MMNGENTLNLDQKAAQYAQKMVEKAKEVEVKKQVETLERLVTKTLGVLQEQGVYAMMLFLYSRTSDESKIALVIRTQLFQLLSQIPEFSNDNIPPDNALTALKFYSDQILDNLDRTFLVRDLYEQTLIYARYGAKAAKEDSPQNESPAEGQS